MPFAHVVGFLPGIGQGRGCPGIINVKNSLGAWGKDAVFQRRLEQAYRAKPAGGRGTEAVFQHGFKEADCAVVRGAAAGHAGGHCRHADGQLCGRGRCVRRFPGEHAEHLFHFSVHGPGLRRGGGGQPVYRQQGPEEQQPGRRAAVPALPSVFPGVHGGDPAVGPSPCWGCSLGRWSRT